MKYVIHSTLTLAMTAATISLPMTASAKPSVNDMSGCVATLDYVTAKLQSLPKSKYDKADRAALLDALTQYRAFIQDEHITPGLLEFNGGDQAKADAMQQQVTDYQNQVVASHDAKFKGERLYTDHAVMIDGCYTKAPMAASQTPMMSAALQSMVKMAQQK
ncbi:hypothetical protein ACJ3XI_11220 [Litorimonas sp. RW-G-Af-16]|uniref:hypothetical protein n=1 Tax=Litorimonas sp. RW-G-Af-16 TaxID=3241168 RepID=UPI00390C7BC0